MKNPPVIFIVLPDVLFNKLLTEGIFCSEIMNAKAAYILIRKKGTKKPKKTKPKYVISIFQLGLGTLSMRSFRDINGHKHKNKEKILKETVLASVLFQTSSFFGVAKYDV